MSLTCTFHPRPVSHSTATFKSFESTEPKVSILGSTSLNRAALHQATWSLSALDSSTAQGTICKEVRSCMEDAPQKTLFQPQESQNPQKRLTIQPRRATTFIPSHCPLSHIATFLHSKVHFPPRRGCCMLA